MKNFSGTFRIGIEKQYFFSTIILLCFIAILYMVQDVIGYETVSMILLLIIFILPLFNFSKGPIILSAVISALAWDYYFIPPHFTMHIAKTEDVVMPFMFFIVASTNGVLAAKLNKQKYEMLIRERKLKAMFGLVKGLTNAKDLFEVMNASVQETKKVFDCELVFFFPGISNQLNRIPYPHDDYQGDELEWLAAEASYKMKVPAGNTTSTVGNAEAFYFPVLNDNKEVKLVIGINISGEIKSNQNEIMFLKEYIKELVPFIEKYPAYTDQG